MSSQPEGLVVKEGDEWVYKYFKTDHVGSVRALLAARGGNKLIAEQVSDFYPSGFARGGLNNLHLNKYLYGGKEYQDGLDLGYYDFHARQYNSFLVRWSTQDPKLQTTNPYLYCGNSPMMYVDPDGEWFWFAAAFFAVANGSMNFIQNFDNGDSFWQGLGNFGIGALAGAAGSLAGGAVSGLVSSSFISPATTALQSIGQGIAAGAAGGLAGGFASGATGAWLSGASFEKGFETGLASGGIGALTGGVMGGIQGASAYCESRNNFLAAYPDAQMHTKIERSDKALREFSNKYFKDYKYNDRTILSYDSKQGASGSTSRKPLGGKYVVKFGNAAFNNDHSMYITMGHEYVHVAHYINIPEFTNALSEAAAYEYTLKLLDINPGNYNVDKVKAIQNTFFNRAGISGSSGLPSKYTNYQSWGLQIGYPAGIFR